jgi:glucosamine-phosphate N-acetyltransferase
LIIRQVQECDLRELINLMQEAFPGSISRDLDSFDRWMMTPNQYTFVGIMDKQIVASYTITIEHKLIHNYGKVAHGEDLAVRKDYQGKGLAKRMMEYGIEFAKTQGVYKFLTESKEEMVEPYNRYLGTYRHEVSLRRDF